MATYVNPASARYGAATREQQSNPFIGGGQIAQSSTNDALPFGRRAPVAGPMEGGGPLPFGGGGGTGETSANYLLAPGVEERARMAREAAGPQPANLVVNGGRPYAAPPAVGSAGQEVAGDSMMFGRPGPQTRPTTTAPASHPMMFGMPAPQAAPQANAMNPSHVGMMFGRSDPSLMGGGMDPRGISERGTPLPGTKLMGGGMDPRGIAARGPVAQPGRSRFDPNRMAETMVRHGDPRGENYYLELGKQREGQAFAREQFGAQQQASDAREERGYAHQEFVFGQQQVAAQQREQTRGAWTLQKEVERAANQEQQYQRKRQDALSDEQRKAGFTVVPADPNEPNGAKVVLNGNGGIHSTIAAKKSKDSTQIGVAKVPGTEDYLVTRDDVPMPSLGTYSRPPGWSATGDTTLKPKGKDPKLPNLQHIQGHAGVASNGSDTVPDRVFDPSTGKYYLPGEVPERTAKVPAKPGAGAAGGAAEAYNPFNKKK